MSSFAKCMASERPENTLFEGVNGWHVGFSEMKEYLPLILALFEISPTCVFGLFNIFLVMYAYALYILFYVWNTDNFYC